jgi:hypothetical protein
MRNEVMAGLEGVKKCWGQPVAANVIIDKQGVRNGRLWQSPMFSQLPLTHFPRQVVRNAG